MTSKAQKRAQARYDKKRPRGILVRFFQEELSHLDGKRLEGESRPAAIKRILRL